MSTKKSNKKPLFMGVQESFNRSGSAALLDEDRNLAGRMLNSASQETALPPLEKAVYLRRSTLQFSDYEGKVYNIVKKDITSGQDASLEALAIDIANRGIQSPLLVIPASLGMYEIISGHRRCSAYDIAIEKYDYNGGQGLPCIILQRPQEGKEFEVMEALILNNLQREKSDYERMMEIVELRKCIQQRKEQGESVRRVRAHLKELLGISDTEITRFDKIHSSLSSKLMPAFRAGRIASTVAYEVAKMEKEHQDYIADNWDYSDAPTLQIALVNNLVSDSLSKMSAEAGKSVGEEDAAPKKMSKLDIPKPNTIEEGVDMLDRTYANVRRVLSTSAEIDKKTKTRILSRISKQMAQLVALQNELALLGLCVEGGETSGE